MAADFPALEWVRQSDGTHRLRPPADGWPDPLRWHRLLPLAIALWWRHRIVYLCTERDALIHVKPVTYAHGRRAYLTGDGETDVLFSSALDALRGAIVEYGARPRTQGVYTLHQH